MTTPIYNATGHDLVGSLPVHFVYDQDLYAPGSDRAQAADPARVKAAIAACPKGVLALIDHEPPAPFNFVAPVSWDSRATASQCRRNVRQMLALLESAQAVNPQVQPWGWTVSDDYGGEQDPNRFEREMADVANTLALRPLADKCSVITVAAYRQVGQSDADYRAHALRLIARARVWAKPVLITICPANVDPEAFAQDVKLLGQYADGVILWDWDPANIRTAWIAPMEAQLSQ